MTDEAYAEEKERLESELERDQRRLGRAVKDLEEAAREAVSPTGLVARHPYPFLLSAAALGFLLGRR